MSWVDGAVVGFDTETTGLDVRTDRIVSAAVVRRRGTATRVDTWLLDPGVVVPAEAAALHGMSTAHVRRYGQPAAEGLEEIAALLARSLRQGEPLVAFNAPFDLTMLDAELTRHRLPTLADRLPRDVRVVLDPLVLDRTLDRARPGRRRLTNLVELYCGGRPARLHRADVDARTTLAVLDGLVRRFPHLAHADLDDLHDHQVRAHGRWVEQRNARRDPRPTPVIVPGTRPWTPAEPGWPVRTAGHRVPEAAVGA